MPKIALFYKIIFFSLLIGAYSIAIMKPNSILVSGLSWDKANHSIAFFILIISLNLAFHLSHKNKIILIGIFGIFIEFSQYFIKYRSAEIYDVIADFIGIFIGIFSIIIYRKYKL